MARLPVDEGEDCLSAWQRRLTNGIAFATIKDNRKERPDLVTVNLASRDLLGGSSALRINSRPEVCPHHRAFAF